MEDLRAKVKERRSFLEKVMNYIPLYHGYKQKELRRESDRLLRNYIHQILVDAKSNLNDIQNSLVENDKIDDAKKMDKFIIKFETISQKINHAEAGYAGFWDADKIKENELDKLYEIDNNMATIANDAKTTIADFAKKTANTKSNIDTDLAQISEKLQKLEDEMSNRKNFLHGMIQ